jgi:hypothetical protein
LNFVAHIAVGRRVCDVPAIPDVLVGTALPDFAAIARMRLDAGSGVLADGIAVHHATDEVFHRDPWFLDVERCLRAELSDKGLSEGAARACAHVGPELLLDGELVVDRDISHDVARVFEAIADPDEDVLTAVAPDHRGRWRVQLHGIAKRLDPLGYRDPEIVARRLHAVASRRPRLAFDESSLPVVTEVMAATKCRVSDIGFEIFERVAGAVDARAPLPRHGGRSVRPPALRES